jgi:hypothetical protein
MFERMTPMDADECRELALLYREVADETSGNERDGLLAIAAQLEDLADEEDGSTPRTIH